MGQKKKSLVVFSLSKRGRTMVRPGALTQSDAFFENNRSKVNFTQKKNTFNVSEQLQILRSYKIELKKRIKKNKQILKSLDL